MKKQYIIIHHEAGNGGFNVVNEWHRKLWNWKSSLGYYCGYHIYIDRQGNMTKARNLTEEGAHTKYWNSKAVGICLMGNFVYDKPTEQQLTVLKKLVDEIRNKYNIPKKNVLGHKEVPGARTLCPAQLMDWIKQYRTKKGRLELIQQQINAIRIKLLALLKLLKLFH